MTEDSIENIAAWSAAAGQACYQKNNLSAPRAYPQCKQK
jgi:hypothetical protein